MISVLEKCVKCCDIFINSYFIYFGYNTAYITEYGELDEELEEVLMKALKLHFSKTKAKQLVNTSGIVVVVEGKIKP